MANFMIYKILPQLKKKIARALRTDVGSIPALPFPSCVGNVGAAQRNTQQPLPGFVAAPCPLISSSLVLLYVPIVSRFLKPSFRTRWRHRQIGDIPCMFWVCSACLCGVQGAHPTKGSSFFAVWVALRLSQRKPASLPPCKKLAPIVTLLPRLVFPYSEGLEIQHFTALFTEMFNGVLTIIPNDWKQPKCPTR